MGKAEPIRSAPEDPVKIGDRAMDNLRYIRETMERSTRFTAVPGYGGILMGVTAIAAAWIANDQPSVRNWLAVWIAEAALAGVVGLFAMWQKSKIAATPLVSGPARKLLMSALPPMLSALFITLGLWRFGQFELMVPVWIISYGAAVVCAGAFSVKPVPVMGWCFISIGVASFFVPAGYGNVLMAVSFGLLHIVFGLIIGRRFGG